MCTISKVEYSHGVRNLIQACRFTNMKSKILVNTFYILGIVVSVMGLKWALQAHNYPVAALFIGTALFFLYLKMKMIGEVKAVIKEKENSMKASAKDETN